MSTVMWFFSWNISANIGLDCHEMWWQLSQLYLLRKLKKKKSSYFFLYKDQVLAFKIYLSLKFSHILHFKYILQQFHNNLVMEIWWEWGHVSWPFWEEWICQRCSTTVEFTFEREKLNILRLRNIVLTINCSAMGWLLALGLKSHHQKGPFLSKSSCPPRRTLHSPLTMLHPLLLF